MVDFAILEEIVWYNETWAHQLLDRFAKTMGMTIEVETPPVVTLKRY